MDDELRPTSVPRPYRAEERWSERHPGLRLLLISVVTVVLTCCFFFLVLLAIAIHSGSGMWASV